MKNTSYSTNVFTAWVNDIKSQAKCFSKTGGSRFQSKKSTSKKKHSIKLAHYWIRSVR